MIPGLELTLENEDAALAGHAVAVGLHEFAGVEDGLEPALRAARAQGAAMIAAHPYPLAEARGASRNTAAFATDPDRWAPLVDRFELFNRDTLFRWVADAGLPAVACGDFHVPAHLATWKTLLPCAKDPAAVVEYLRSPRPAFLARLEPEPETLTQSGMSCRYGSYEQRSRSEAVPCTFPGLGRLAGALEPGAAAGGTEGLDRVVSLREGRVLG